MPVHWTFESRRGIGVLAVRGFLGDEAAPALAGAVGWALARSTGPIVVDLSRLLGYSHGGEAALAEATRRVTNHRRVLAICGFRGIPAQRAGHPPTLPINVYTDLDSALAALQP